MPRDRVFPSGAPSWTVTGEAAGIRLDKFLAAETRLGSRSRVVAALDRGKVFLNDAEAGPQDAGRALQAGDVVRLWIDRPGSARGPRRPINIGDLQILYEDDALLVVNKPAGLLAVPLPRKSDASSVYAQLEEYLRPRGRRKPLIVHRIDRDTSGLVVFAKHAAAQSRLKDQFSRREPERVYLAVVYGHLQPAEGVWRDYLVWDAKALIQKRTRSDDRRGKEAISRYRVLEAFSETSLAEIRLETGKRNQIRIQAGLRGHPLVGERRYVFAPPAPIVSFVRQALHAQRLSFRHPEDERVLCFEAPPPRDFAELLTRLRRGGGHAPVPAGRTRAS